MLYAIFWTLLGLWYVRSVETSDVGLSYDIVVNYITDDLTDRRYVLAIHAIFLIALLFMLSCTAAIQSKLVLMSFTRRVSEWCFVVKWSRIVRINCNVRHWFRYFQSFVLSIVRWYSYTRVFLLRQRMEAFAREFAMVISILILHAQIREHRRTYFLCTRYYRIGKKSTSADFITTRIFLWHSMRRYGKWNGHATCE